MLGAGHGHITKPPLLLHFLRLPDGTGAGEQTFLHAYHKDHRELQTLGRVHGHHDHAVVPSVVSVQIGVQGDLVQKAGQGRLIPGIFQIAVNGSEQLAHIFKAGTILHGIFALQHHSVTGAGDQLLIKIRQIHRAGQPTQLLHHLSKGRQLGRRTLQLGILVGVADHIVQRAPLSLGNALGGVHRLVSNAPGRIIDDAAQPQIVLRVIEYAQIGHHVLDLRAVKKAGAADDLIGDTIALAGIFHLVGLGVHAVENGVVFPCDALGIIIQNTHGHILRLVVFIHGGIKLQLVPCPCLCPQLLALAPLVIADHGVGGVEDIAGGAVVLLQTDDTGIFILLLKGQNILNGRAPEAVDGLVIVTHYAEVLVSTRQRGGQQVLQIVGVLILVDEHIAEFALIVSTHLLVLLEQTHRVQDDIVKVQRAGLPQAAFILGINLGDLFLAEVTGTPTLRQILRSQLHLVLGAGDVTQHRTGRELLVVDIVLLENVLDDPQRVVRIVDGEGGGKAQLFNVSSQDAYAGGVEGTGPDLVGGGAEHPLQTLLQLPGGLVGKGDGKDRPGRRRLQLTQPLGTLLPPGVGRSGIALQKGYILRRDPFGHFHAVRAPTVFHQVGDAVDQHGGLAAACPCQQQQRPFRGQHGLLLLLVHLIKIMGDGRPARLAKAQFQFVIQHCDFLASRRFNSTTIL